MSKHNFTTLRKVISKVLSEKTLDLICPIDNQEQSEEQSKIDNAFMSMDTELQNIYRHLLYK